MARVVAGPKRAAMDPLKHSQALGGVLAFLGVAGCMPLLHGPQGCSAFAKALLTRHFREPVPLQTTAVTEVSAVLGATESLLAALATVTERHRPQVIGVLTTGVTEVCGEDLAGALRTYRAGAPAGGPLVVAASTPDFHGGLSDGWSAALTALVTATVAGAAPVAGRDRAAGDAPGPGGPSGPAGWASGAVGPGAVDPGLVAVLAGPSLTAVDLDEIAGLVRGVGLRPVLVPDLSGSVDGHLADGWSPLTTGGTTVADLGRLPAAGTVCTVGAAAGPAGAALAARSGAVLSGHDHLSGLAAVDAFVAGLLAVARDRSGGRAVVSERIRRWRARLADGLLDSHFVLGGARVAVAGEPEFLVAVSSLLAGAGAEVVAAVSATDADVLRRAPCAEVVVGDLVDLADRAGDAGAELVVAGSHARDLAAGIGAAHLVAGFPVHDRLGVQLRATAGYRGSLQFLVDAGNELLEHRRHGSRPGPDPTGSDALWRGVPC